MFHIQWQTISFEQQLNMYSRGRRTAERERELSFPKGAEFLSKIIPIRLHS